MFALAGTWELIRAEQNGEAAPELVALRVELELTADTYLVRFAGQVAGRGTYTAEAGDLTFTGTAGPNRGHTIPLPLPTRRRPAARLLWARREKTQRIRSVSGHKHLRRDSPTEAATHLVRGRKTCWLVRHAVTLTKFAARI